MIDTRTGTSPTWPTRPTALGPYLKSYGFGLGAVGYGSYVYA